MFVGSVRAERRWVSSLSRTKEDSGKDCAELHAGRKQFSRRSRHTRESLHSAFGECFGFSERGANKKETAEAYIDLLARFCQAGQGNPRIAGRRSRDIRQNWQYLQSN